MYFNIAQLLERQSNGEPWTKVPFSLFIEGLHKIQPRYYSISSSSLKQKQKISITAVVESTERPGAPHVVKGVTTNYLLALKQKQHGDPSPDPHGLDYAITGPRNKYDGIHVPVHVRHSNFKLPSDPLKPIIMVGPGTGVAPFRAFVQERAEQAKKGEQVGKTILFFGCRKKDEDFIYKDEWEVRIAPFISSVPQLLIQMIRNTSNSWAITSKFTQPSLAKDQTRSMFNTNSRKPLRKSTSYWNRRHTFTSAVMPRVWHAK